jgi:dTMP kinase
VVICDRYVDSSLAYQGGGRRLPIDEIAWLSAWATRQLKPDLVVLLDVPPEVGLARVNGRGRTDRLEKEDLAFHERVRHVFLDLAAADPRRYLVIDGTRPVDDIAAEVLARVDSMLPPTTEPPAQRDGSQPSPRELSAIATGQREPPR